MANCCNGDIIDLGCIASCDLIETGQDADATGIYILELIGGVRVVSNTVTSGDEITFSGGYLNEDMVTIFKIIKPNGEYLTVGESDCFQVSTTPTTTPTLSDTDCGEATVENSDGTFSETVECGDTLELEDQTINILIDGVQVATSTVPAMQDNTINIIWT